MEQTIKETLSAHLQKVSASQDKIPKLLEIEDERLENHWDKYIHLQLLWRQSKEDEYSVQERQSMDMDDIFTDRVNKVLLLGGGGMGKSTFLHYIYYNWGKNRSWSDNYDFVFLVKLKVLLDSSWLGDYTREEKKKMLCCLIHHCLLLQIEELPDEDKVEIELLEVCDMVNNGRVLLLLDGFNEIESLCRNKSRTDYSNLMKQIYNSKDVIMTSRPNSLQPEDQRKFDRIIEMKGLDLDGIVRYVDLFFIENNQLGSDLKSFLKRSTQVRGICEIPINAILICLIWEDESTREGFKDAKDLTVGSLYHKVILWLGKRYLEKFEGRDAENIVDSNIFVHPILKFLRKVAYEAFIKNGNFVSADIVSENLGTIDITVMYKFGLLKALKDVKRLTDLNYVFIHSTFQEYLTGEHLAELISGEEGNVTVQACSLIAEHRNEPKYLMMLKFLAGIISNMQNANTALVRFWEIMMSNVDETLELGFERKVVLMMHLLEQSRLDERIPKLEEMKNLIDNLVLHDINKWGGVIIESGYISLRIRDKIKDAADFLSLKVTAEVMSYLVNKNEFGGRTDVTRYMLKLVNDDKWQVKVIGLQKLDQVLDSTVNTDVLGECLEAAKSNIENINLQNYCKNVLVKIISLMPDSKYNVIDSLPQKMIFAVLKDAVRVVPKEIVSGVVGMALSLIIEFYESNVDILKPISGVVKLIKSLPEGEAKIASNKLFHMFCNDKFRSNVKLGHQLVCESEDIIEMMSPEVAKRVFDTLVVPNLAHLHYILCEYMKQFWNCVKSLFKLMTLEDSIQAKNTVFETILDNMEVNCVEHLEYFVADLPSTAHNSLLEKAFSVLYYDVENNHFSVVSVNYLSSILPLVLGDKEHTVTEVYKKLISSKRFKSDNNFSVAAVNTILSVLTLINSVDCRQNILQYLFRELFEALKQPEMSPLKMAALNSIDSVVGKMAPEESRKTADELLPILLNIIESDPFFIFVLAAMSLTIRMLKCVDFNSSRVSDLFETLSFVVNNENAHVDCRSAAMCKLTEIFKCLPESKVHSIIGQGLKAMSNIIGNKNVPVEYRFRAIESISDVVDYITDEQIEAVVKLVVAVNDMNIFNIGISYSIIEFNKAYIMCKVAGRLSGKQAHKKSEKVFSHICRILQDTQVSASDKQNIGKYMRRIIQVRDLSASVTLLNNVNLYIRKGAKLGIARKLKDTQEFGYYLVFDLLEILNLESSEDKEGVDLCLEAKKKLKEIMPLFDSTAVKFLNDNFDKMEDSLQTKLFLAQLYHKVLSEFPNFTPEVAESFIIKCIKYGFTLTLRRKKSVDDTSFTYSIVFEDICYVVNSSIEQINNIAKAVIVDSNDALAEQYRTYKPLFPRSEPSVVPGLKMAAVDYHLISIIHPTDIGSEMWKLYLMHLTNHQLKEPSNVFLILEKRDSFGYHVICKIHKVERRLIVDSYTLHPSEVSQSFCKSIFGDMSYNNTKPRYLYSTWDCKVETGDNILKSVESLDSNDTQYNFFHKFLNNNINWPFLTWDEYKEGDNAYIVGKDKLLKLNKEEQETRRRDSLSIETVDDISTLNQCVEELVKIIEEAKKDPNYNNEYKEIDKQLKSLSSETGKQIEDLRENLIGISKTLVNAKTQIGSLNERSKIIFKKIAAMPPACQQ